MTNKERLREKTLADVNRARQSTFDKLPEPKAPKFASISNKAIEIAQLQYNIKQNELELSIVFLLLPSKNSFSNLMLDLYFDNEKLQTYTVSIPPTQLLSDELEFPVTLDLQGICPGQHTVKVEIFERWSSGEKLTSASKYVIIDYVPTRKEDRYIKVPIVRKIDGAFRIIMPEEQDLFDQLERSRREELNGKRDHW